MSDNPTVAGGISGQQAGPLTKDQLQAIWKGSVDPHYADAMIAAGEGEGFEAYTQAFAMFERVSQAIDRSIQAMFLKFWSGQSQEEQSSGNTPAEPATGASKATVTLSITRSKLLQHPMHLRAGELVIGEEQIDWGESGGVSVLTGRRFILTQDLVFHPGEVGPFNVQAIAERPGYGFNNPLPGTIKHIYQPGTKLNNSLAGFDSTPASTYTFILTTYPLPDVVTPDNVGSYIGFTQFNSIESGGTPTANNAQVWRVNQYYPSSTTDIPSHGGKVSVDYTFSVQGSSPPSNTNLGQAEDITINQPGSGLPVATGKLIGWRTTDGLTRASFILKTGSIDPTYSGTITGLQSGYTLGFSFVSNLPTWQSGVVGSVPSLVWRVLDWVDDWGMAVTHTLSPTGGKLGVLDELGKERDVNRSPGESDNAYRDRIVSVADVVSPNAIRRVANKILSAVGASVCLREGSTHTLPGFYFDQDFYGYASTDLDWLNPNNGTKWRTWLDISEFRGFFMIGIPDVGTDSFGFYYDDSVNDQEAYDLTPGGSVINVFYDGENLLAENFNKQIYQAVDGARAAGVSFDLYIETDNCLP